jgi:hypothetical protein
MQSSYGKLALSIVFDIVPAGHNDEAAVTRTALWLDQILGSFFARESNHRDVENNVAAAIYSALGVASLTKDEPVVIGIACRLSHCEDTLGEIEKALYNLPQHVYVVIYDLDEQSSDKIREWRRTLHDNTMTSSNCIIVAASDIDKPTRPFERSESSDNLAKALAGDIEIWRASQPSAVNA